MDSGGCDGPCRVELALQSVSCAERANAPRSQTKQALCNSPALQHLADLRYQQIFRTATCRVCTPTLSLISSCIICYNGTRIVVTMANTVMARNGGLTAQLSCSQRRMGTTVMPSLWCACVLCTALRRI